jgi:hypothetical protein
MICDSFFGTISRYLTRRDVFLPTDYLKAIAESSKDIKAHWVPQQKFQNWADFLSGKFCSDFFIRIFALPMLTKNCI